MLTVMLYGFLGQRFGRVHRYAARTPAEAVRALCATLPGFRQALVDGGAYRVLRGGKEALDTAQIAHPHSSRESLRIVPVVSGAGRGLGMIVLGAAMIWAGPAVWSAMGGVAGGTMATMVSSAVTSIGTSMIIGGVSQMLFSPPSTQNQTVEAANNRPSYAFDGAVNTAAQGNPVPVCYGRLIVGSQVVSAGLQADDIGASGGVVDLSVKFSGKGIFGILSR